MSKERALQPHYVFERPQAHQPHEPKHEHNSLSFDKSKGNYLQRCYYVINLMKDKDYDLWENFHAQHSCTKPEESWELFQMVVEEYRKLCAPPKTLKMPRKKAAKKVAARRSAGRKAA